MSAFIAILKDTTNNCTNANLYTDINAYKTDTFTPTTETVNIIPLCVRGKTYADKKRYLRDIATEYSNADLGGISYGEIIVITDFFRENARRYGLTREFKENAII